LITNPSISNRIRTYPLPNPEIKMLRDERARLIAESLKLHKAFCEAQAEYADLVAEKMMLEARLAYYENPHSPPTRGPVPSQQGQQAGSALGSPESPARPGYAQTK